MKKIHPNSMPQNAPSQAPAHMGSPRCRVFGFRLPFGHVTVAASSSSSRCCFCRPWATSSPLSAPSGVSNFRTTSDDAMIILLFLGAANPVRDFAAPQGSEVGGEGFLQELPSVLFWYQKATESERTPIPLSGE